MRNDPRPALQQPLTAPPPPSPPSHPAPHHRPAASSPTHLQRRGQRRGGEGERGQRAERAGHWPAPVPPWPQQRARPCASALGRLPLHAPVHPTLSERPQPRSLERAEAWGGQRPGGQRPGQPHSRRRLVGVQMASESQRGQMARQLGRHREGLAVKLWPRRSVTTEQRSGAVRSLAGPSPTASACEWGLHLRICGQSSLLCRCAASAGQVRGSAALRHCSAARLRWKRLSPVDHVSITPRSSSHHHRLQLTSTSNADLLTSVALTLLLPSLAAPPCCGHLKPLGHCLKDREMGSSRGALQKDLTHTGTPRTIWRDPHHRCTRGQPPSADATRPRGP